MVIHQFNRLIRNKWVWGVFAIIISVAFCFDGLFTQTNDEPSSARGAGSLAGETVSAETFLDIVEEIRGFGQQRDWKTPANEVNRQAWQNYAALKVAEKDGIEATDADIQAMIRHDSSFQKNGGFNFALYQALLRQNGLTPERYEAYLKRRMTLMRIGQSVLSSAAWASPMEVDQAVADMTDTFTVKVANFTQTKKEADAVKVNDTELKKWYDENVKTLQLPERIKIRYVKFNTADPVVLAKMSVTEEEIRDQFDVSIDKYTTKDTNGVEKVRTFEELTKAEKDGIERDLRKIAATQYFETNLNARAYGVESVSGASRLDEIAKEENAKVETSDWFAINGRYEEGFMKRVSAILPGAKDFETIVAELDSSSEDLRYGVVSSSRAVWLIEKSETSAAHTPTFEEAKDAIRPRALRDAKAEAFKKQVEAIAAKGAKAVAAVKGVSTNLVFNVTDLRMTSAAFENQMAVARAAMSLQKGEVSKFTQIAPGKAILVVCEDRVAGDAAKAMVLRSQIRDDVAMLQMRQIPESWMKWNLDRMGFETNELSSLEEVEVEE